jgi:hypothetical protein
VATQEGIYGWSGGRVVDKEKGAVYSPKQINKMKRKSDEKRDK